MSSSAWYVEARRIVILKVGRDERAGGCACVRVQEDES